MDPNATLLRATWGDAFTIVFGVLLLAFASVSLLSGVGLAGWVLLALAVWVLSMSTTGAEYDRDLDELTLWHGFPGLPIWKKVSRLHSAPMRVEVSAWGRKRQFKLLVGTTVVYGHTRAGPFRKMVDLLEGWKALGPVPNRRYASPRVPRRAS